MHYLTGCSALQPRLNRTVQHGLASLDSFPLLKNLTIAALDLPPSELFSFLVDPSTFPPLISHAQEFGQQSIYPIFRFCRSYIWAMHSERLRLKQLATD